MGTVIDNTIVKKYPAYKDSGIEWSGLVPENWGALPLRAIFEERNEKNEGPKTDYILSVTKDRGVIPYDEKGAIGNNKSEDIERYKLVYPNDFVINKMNVIIGSLGMSKYFGAFSQVYLVYKPRTSQININYYSYIFSNPSFYKSLIKYCTGIMELRESLNKEDFKKLILPFPDFQTQTSIVEYLDRKTVLIEQAIGIKIKQIELLKENRQILISKAVTHGLNPNVKLKDSGIEWIGKIPNEWSIKELRYLKKEGTEITYGIVQAGPDIQDGVPYIRTGDMYGEVLPKTGYLKTSKRIASSFHRSRVSKGDLVVAIRATLGKALLVPDHLDGANLTQGTARIAVGLLLDNEFLYWVFNSKYVQTEIDLNAKGTTFREITLNRLRRLSIALPSIEEQKQITAFVKNVFDKFATAISLKEQEIEKLKEYKATLINSAVTGKIKVN